MAGSPINPAMQQYLNGLNATVYNATAGIPTAGVGAGAASVPMNPYAAPGGYTAAPVPPANTQFTGSQAMMNPAQQASNQAEAQQNPPSKGEAAKNFIQDNQTALMVGGAALLAGGGFLAYRSNQNKKEAAAAAAKSKSSSSTSSSAKPSPPAEDSQKSSSSSATNSGKPSAEHASRPNTPHKAPGGGNAKTRAVASVFSGVTAAFKKSPKPTPAAKTPPPMKAHGKAATSHTSESDRLVNNRIKELNKRDQAAYISSGGKTLPPKDTSTGTAPEKRGEQSAQSYQTYQELNKADKQNETVRTGYQFNGKASKDYAPQDIPEFKSPALTRSSSSSSTETKLSSSSKATTNTSASSVDDGLHMQTRTEPEQWARDNPYV